MNKLLSILIACLFLGLLSCDKGERILNRNIKDIEEYLEDNNLSAQRTDDDLFYIIEEEGNGVFPTATSIVEVDYHGYFLDGEVFDSSVDRGTPAQFSLQQVILGWTEGIPLFSEGGSGILLIPSHLAYGEFGSGNIPGETVLVFEIDLIETN